MDGSTKWPYAKNLYQPNHIELPKMSDFSTLYRWADVVVVPMQRNTYSGITVADGSSCHG